jgi:hypothetical protein
MKKHIIASGLTLLLALAAQAQIIQPTMPPGKIAVLKAGTSDNAWPMITSRVAPIFVQVFDPATTNQSSTNALLSVAMSITSSVPGSVWINHHAGSEGGGLSRSIDRQYLALEGYTGNILSPTAAKPSTDPTVTRGIVRLNAFTNAVSIYSDLANWFGIPAGSASGTQDNPTGIATMDGTNYWGTGNFAGTSSELDGTLFFNQTQNIDPDTGRPLPQEIQNYVQAAAEARIIGGTLYVVVPGIGVINFINPASQTVVPLPYDPNVANPYESPALTNLFINWGPTFTKIANFDMNPSATIAYGADQTYGIVKFTNNAGTWVQAPYYFGTTNLGTTAQAAASQGCFAICVDFSGTNPVIYATTMENGYPVVNTKQGHQNQNRLISIVDTGINPGTNLVVQTLAVAATTNEFFGGIDFTPDLRPLITSNPANYATTNGGSAPFGVTAQSPYALSYQWLQNGTNLVGATSALLNLTDLNTTNNNYAYQCVVTNNYGAVTSTPAILTVTASPVTPVITSGTNYVAGIVNNGVTFAAVSATGTDPLSYQWYYGTNMLVDGANPNNDGSGYSGSLTSSLSVTNLQLTDAGNYYVVVNNSAGYASNLVDVLAVNYQTAFIAPGEPQSVTTFVGASAALTANESGATPPVTYQWYLGTNALTDLNEISGSATPTLTISLAGTNDTGANYYIVVSNPGGSVTSSVASVTVLVPPAHSFVSYTNQLYFQTFDSLPDPGGVSVNSINNPGDPGTINGLAYSLANPFDFAYPVINNSYVGGVGLPNTLNGWYGAADTLPDVTTPDGISRFGAQDGDQTTGGVIDFGPDDVNGGIVGTNRALGLLSTSTTGSTTFALKLINTSTNALNYINLSFIGELWHNGTGARVMSCGYALDNTSTNFVLSSESISNVNTTLVPGLAFSFPTAATVTTVDGTQPSNQVDLATNNLALSSPWQTNGALWLVWSINYYGSGSGNGYAIDNLSVSGTTVPTTVPSATTLAATKVAATNAQFNASINPSNGPTAYWFNYGTTTGYGSSSTTNILGVVSGPASVASLINGLSLGTQYHYQIVATNIAGITFGADQTFTTVALPAFTTLTVSNITASSATLDATVNPRGGATTYWFKYGTSTSYGGLSVTNAAGSGSSPLTVTDLISGLLQGTVYHYQIVATNLAGLATNTDANFTTLAVTPPQLNSVAIPGGGHAFQFSFTNATGASFSVLATNNLSAPKTNWPVVGHAVESPAGSGNYQFTNSPLTNMQFYILRQP